MLTMRALKIIASVTLLLLFCSLLFMHYDTIRTAEDPDPQLLIRTDFSNIFGYEYLIGGDRSGQVIPFDSSTFGPGWNLNTKGCKVTSGVHYYIPKKYDGYPLDKWASRSDAIIATGRRILALYGSGQITSGEVLPKRILNLSNGHQGRNTKKVGGEGSKKEDGHKSN